MDVGVDVEFEGFSSRIGRQGMKYTFQSPKSFDYHGKFFVFVGVWTLEG